MPRPKDILKSASINTGVSDGSGRIFVVTEPPLPATCVVCRRSANGAVKFIDFNLQLDYYGAVVFCEDCIKESLHVLDFIPTEKLQEVIEALTRTVEELEVVKDERDKYKSALDGLSFIRPDLNPLVVDDGNESEDSVESVGAESEPESNPDGSDSSGGLKDVSIFAD